MSRLVEQWIAAAQDESPVRANSLIITVYGDSIAPHGGTVWLGSLIRLVVPLRLNPRVARTSVFQLSRESWLQSEQIGRRSYYSLTAAGRRRFVERFRPLLRALRNARNRDPQQCFAVRTLLIHEVRRVLLRDPQLPAQLRPLDWLGAAARQLCRDLYLVTYREAERHLHATLETTTGALPQAEPEFYECFGGFPPQVSPGAGRVP